MRSRGCATSIREIDPIVAGQGHERVIGTMLDAGRDTAVVVVHGIVGSRRLDEIAAVARALSGEHDVLSIDVRGHGEAPGRFTWGRDEWRDVSVAVGFARRDRRRVHVVGFSFGGFHACLAIARGARVDRLVLVGAPVDLVIWDHFFFGRPFWRHVPAMLRRCRRMPRLGWPSGLRGRALSDDELSAVSADTLVIHGGDDWIVSRRHAERYADRIPRARLVEIPGGFHAEYLMASSRRVFLETLTAFLGE